MQKKVQYINPIGIQKDISPAQAKGTQFVHDMYNKRITQNKESNTFAISSEGNVIQVDDISVTGDIIGLQRIEDYVVYFSKLGNTDYITIWNFKTGAKKEISSNFNFRKQYPIESIGVVETSDIIKVYWVDGINQPRVLNIKNVLKEEFTAEPSSFDFQPALSIHDSDLYAPKITVTKLLNNQGYFHSGVVQYAVSYYNKNGQESPIFLQSDLYYVSAVDRGLSPEEYTSNSFGIYLENIDSSLWEYVRIYRIFRSSLNAEPQVQILNDYKIADLTRVEMQETKIKVSYHMSPQFLDNPKTFTAGSVSAIVFDGKYKQAQADIVSIFSEKHLGTLQQFENTVTTLDGTVVALVFKQDIHESKLEDSTKFTVQYGNNEQVTFLPSDNQYYYIVTNNNTGKVGDIIKIGMCNSSCQDTGIPFSNSGIHYKDVILDGTMQDYSYSYSGFITNLGNMENVKITCPMTFNTSALSSFVTEYIPQYNYISIQNTGVCGQGPRITMRVFKKNEDVLIDTVYLQGLPKYKNKLINDGGWRAEDPENWITITDQLNQYTVFTEEHPYIIGQIDPGWGIQYVSIVVPMEQNKVKISGNSSINEATINCVFNLPTKALVDLYVDENDPTKVNTLNDLRLEFYGVLDAPMENIQTTVDYNSLYQNGLTVLATGTSSNYYSVKWVAFGTQQVIETTDTLAVLNFEDTGTTGQSYDSKALLLKGLTNLTPYTLTHKDNTLFLGNYSTLGNALPSEAKQYFSNKDNVNLSFSLVNTGQQDDQAPLEQNYYYNFHLNKGSAQIKHFRYGQVYRIGIQFLNKRGQWSEVIYLGDIKCEERINTNKYNDTLSQIPELTVTFSTSISNVQGMEDYTAARLMYVEPTILDRNVLCQGIACSTVYNFESRFSNRVFAQASWFARPEFYGTEEEFFNKVVERKEGRYPIEEGSVLEWRMIGNPFYQGLKTKDSYIYRSNTNTLLGLPEQTQFNSEIQGHTSGVRSYTQPLTDPVSLNKNYILFENGLGYLLDKSVTDRQIVINNYKSDYGIDRSIMTLHSPEIEWDEQIKQIDINSYKLRIIGFVPVRQTLSDILVQSDGASYGQQVYGFIKDNIKDSSSSGTPPYLSGKGLINYPFWVDDNAERTTWQEDQSSNQDVITYPIYPWHRNGALNNQGNQDSAGVKARLEHKIMSNLRICLNPYYIPASELTVQDKKLVIDNDFVQSLSLNYNTCGKIKIYYQGNVDTVLEGNKTVYYEQNDTVIKGYPIAMYGFIEDSISKVNVSNLQHNLQNISKGNTSWTNTVHIGQQQDTVWYYNQNYINSYLSTALAISGGSRSVPKYCVFDEFQDAKETNPEGYNTFPAHLESTRLLYTQDGINENNIYSYDSISIKYKSGNHIVFCMSTDNNTINQFPLLNKEDVASDAGYLDLDFTNSNNNFIWQSYTDNAPNIQYNIIQVSDEIINNSYGENFFYYPVVELFKEEIQNQYGGEYNNNINSTIWIPISENFHTAVQTLSTTSGDTYFQRYDHLKTQPYTQQDQNSIVEIVSFPVETYINIDGRYDENRGLESNLIVNKNNFNQLNTVYSQTNNYFSYNSYKNDKVTNKFPNQFTWSLEKVMGEEIDSWTNLTLLNTYDLDGDKGPIQYLERFNDQIYAFQDTGLARIIFNPRVQINTSDGIPVELSNSKKLEGVVYISDTVGNQNKWAIAKGKTGIFFVDKINESFNKFNGQTIESLTDKHFNRSFIENCSQGIWNLYSTEAVNRTRVLYESNTGDYYIQLGNNNWISYNENLGTFTSRYSYDMHFLYELPPYEYTSGNQTLSINNVQAHTIKGNSFSKMNHNNSEPLGTYSTITLVANDQFPIDKVFETVEFRSNDTQQFEDVIGPNPEKNPLHVWANKPVYRIKADNEYQHSDSNNSTDKNVEDHFNTSWLRKKFRVWRAQIPRNNRERIRNMWSYITLYSNIQTSLYDFNIVYYI